MPNIEEANLLSEKQMNMPRTAILLFGLSFILVACSALAPENTVKRGQAASISDRIYAINCAENHAKNLSTWTTPADSGKPFVFSNNCNLIKHGADWVLLNSGNADRIAAIQKIPGVNHPVFKGKPINPEPREVYIKELFALRGEYNVFHPYYQALVQTVSDAGVPRTVYCVNINAVIAALFLKALWQPHQSEAFSSQTLETAAFTIFLYPRMLGCAAEIDDHMNRSRNIDTRTAASSCRFVA